MVEGEKVKLLQMCVMRDALAFYARAERAARDIARANGSGSQIAIQNAQIADELREKIEARIKATRRGQQ